MFKKLKRNKNNQLDLLNNDINIKNLPEKPNSGGTPANDISVKIMNTENDCILPTIFNSFKVLIKRMSMRKKSANMLNNKNKYIVIFNRNNEYTYSL